MSYIYCKLVQHFEFTLLYKKSKSNYIEKRI